MNEALWILVLKIFAWPVVIVTGCLIIFFSIKEAIKQFFERATDAKLGPLSVSTKPGQQASTVELTPKKTAEDLIRGLESNLLLAQFEEAIKAELEALPPDDKAKVLLKHYAATYWAYYFEYVFRLIFGSQIRAIEYLHSQGLSPRESLRPFYDAAANQYAFIYDFYNYDQWLGFLETHMLILNRDGNIDTTLRGVEFLSYLTKNRLLKTKAG